MFVMQFSPWPCRGILWATCVLAPFFLAPASSSTTSVSTALHPKLDGYFPFFFKDYEPNQDLELSFNSFELAFQHMSHLLASGLFKMVFKHLQNYFLLKDSTNEFLQLFQYCFHIAHGRILPKLHVFLDLLAMTKPLNGVCPFGTGETLY
jgi:hypothetical protein